MELRESRAGAVFKTPALKLNKETDSFKYRGRVQECSVLCLLTTGNYIKIQSPLEEGRGQYLRSLTYSLSKPLFNFTLNI